MQAPPERLGSFYLGSVYDLDAGEITDEPVNYDARDLTTHAVCVGMTGSGKTGLCIDLLEEAALDRVPAILIDPKGDITNLLLQFPELQPEDFAPWINSDDARRKGKTVEEFAESTADLWRNGLAGSGIESKRIQTLLDTVDLTIFTPGSDAGVPISILGSLAAPGLDFATEAEAIRERIAGTAAALLGLIDSKADPIRSREAILLANIFEFYWKQNEDLDLAKLIMAIQTPPVRQVGVFDVDTFFPEKDRFEMAMAFNNLMASPTFQSWLIGEPLDIDQLYFTAEGKPRHSIFYIAHLSDSERMFFVTLLLESLVTWMRRQSGTTSLRSLLYFDEIFGFFPPTAEPPSKRPLLTMMKQARAFGVGVVLVTQNPVDLDYKGLTNAGTWMIGKLQAERDKDRVLSGLKGAIAEAGSDSKIDYDELISRLDSRVFLLHNVHADGPVVMHTRWAQSYLRGPMTRPQVRQLMADRMPAPADPTVNAVPTATAQAQPTATAAAASSAPAASQTDVVATPEGFSASVPSLDPKLEQVFLPIEVSDNEALKILEDQGAKVAQVISVQLTYEPALAGFADVRFVDNKRRIEKATERRLLVDAATGPGGIDWSEAEPISVHMRSLENAPESFDDERGPFFASIPDSINSIRELKSAQKELSDWLYYNSRFPIKVHETLDLFQEPGESERSFQSRLQQAAREMRDAEIDKISDKIETARERIEDKRTKEERELEEDRAELNARRLEEATGIGESVLSYFVGRRRTSTMFSRAMTKRRMTTKANLDIQESEEQIADYNEDIAELEEDLQAKIDDLKAKYDDLLDDLSTVELKPRRADVDVQLVALAWKPAWLIRFDDGLRERSVPINAYALPAVG